MPTPYYPINCGLLISNSDLFNEKTKLEWNLDKKWFIVEEITNSDFSAVVMETSEPITSISSCILKICQVTILKLFVTI